jgi:hypothetical protein
LSIALTSAIPAYDDFDYGLLEVEIPVNEDDEVRAEFIINYS